MFNFIRKCFDTRTELQIMANDRNLILVGFGDIWTVCNADGKILATASTQVDAIVKAIFCNH
jgi:hypothetical protein